MVGRQSDNKETRSQSRIIQLAKGVCGNLQGLLKFHPWTPTCSFSSLVSLETKKEFSMEDLGRFNGEFRTTDYKFDKALFWIKLHDLPFNMHVERTSLRGGRN